MVTAQTPCHMNRWLCVSALALLCACISASPPSGAQAGAGVSDSCEAQTCRKGLRCNAAKVCEGANSNDDGEACTVGAECSSGHCAPDGARGVCATAGMGAVGASCQGDGACRAGLKCAFDGVTLFATCRTAGLKDIGHECTASRDCGQGLFCMQGLCRTVALAAMQAAHGYPPAISSPSTGWQGARCLAEKSTGVKALWSLPRETDPDDVKEDFFRLPYPNDAARDAQGRVGFERFPHDPAPPFGFDAVGRYLKALETEPFGSYGAVTFRFDGRLDFGTLSAQGSNPQLRVVDLTAGPRFGTARGLFYFYNSQRNRYVCSNWLTVRPAAGDPYGAGTYAVLMLKGPRDLSGAEVTASDDFVEMLKPTAPAEAGLARAWAAYAPLRAYLADRSLAAAEVLTASVFTVGDPQRLMAKLADAVDAAPAPVADPWVKCGSGASPCADASGARACGNGAGFDEWHTLVELPVFQRGVAPYLSPDAGGDIDFAAAVTPVRREKVCAALTVPKSAPPDGGFPLVLYAHGTGGSFRSHASDGAAEGLAAAQMAVLGFDQVGHGPRRGRGAEALPQDIVFNVANPASARGTMAQGAADLHAMARFLKEARIGAPAPLDAERLAFWGHSQGATQGALFLAHDTRVAGALLSGASASLTHALMSKKAPVNVADSMWLALSESAPGAVTEFHPVLGLLQTWSEVVDPINFARDVVVTPARARDVLQVWGKDDLYTPRAVQAHFALAARVAFVGPRVDEFDVMVVPSAGGNVMGPRTVTAAMRQYAPAGYDGHFVVFQDSTARRDALRFLGRVGKGEIPVVPEP